MKKTVIIAAALAAALAGSVYMKEQNAADNVPQKRKGGSVSVVVSPVEQTQWQRQVEALGTIKARESVELAAKVTERVAQIHFDDGDSVSKGQLLVTLNHAEQDAKLTAARANLVEQQREYRRIEDLVKTKTIASNELDKIRTGIDVAAAIVAQTEAEVDARYIRAPFAGLLGFRSISTGALVSPGTEISTLDDISVVKLDFPVPERYLNELRPGSSISAMAAAFPGQPFVGTVANIDSRVNPTTRAVVVRAELDNADGKLRPGMLMTLKLIVDERRSTIIPEEAVIPRQNRQYVFVVADGKVVEKQITLGSRQRGWVEVESGLVEGELVITRGAQRVRPGQTVTPRERENFSYQEIS
ncbi:efflux RND transporter periplasmic adaptor subunit [Ferrimonas lipolytica]|uniref:Efflux RND transporter periplasmic adaptor subunit n=1 Tax=Ferrimonas lipolytica TaxID=2724191 RepID=A0A6H1UFB6_9GAMM|nr:efflux RND transporter periplasmic adaptor subunit [Ferrimonas lipolytica]QIZ76906.1 efflux RND transporter periplasmic adaptor subunit [Ferrimonas lipolytica]